MCMVVISLFFCCSDLLLSSSAGEAGQAHSLGPSAGGHGKTSESSASYESTSTGTRSCVVRERSVGWAVVEKLNKRGRMRVCLEKKSFLR